MMSLVLLIVLLLVLPYCLPLFSYQYPKTRSLVDVCRDIVIYALGQAIQWLLCLICQVIKKFATLLLALCWLVFTVRMKHVQDPLWQAIWWLCQQVLITSMVGLVVIISKALITVAIPSSRQDIRAFSEELLYQFIKYVLSASARDQKPNNKPNFQRKPDIPIVPFCPVVSPKPSTDTYIDSALSSPQDSQEIHTLVRISDDRRQKLRSIKFRREWNLQSID